MRLSFLVLLVGVVFTGQAFAADDHFTATANETARVLADRTPGADVVGELAMGDAVDIVYCYSPGTFCKFQFEGRDAFVEGAKLTTEWDGERVDLVARYGLFNASLKVGADAAAAIEARPTIVAWGDSLTAGTGSTGGSTRPHSYPAVAQTLLGYGTGMVNNGIGGQTSTQIAARMGALDIVARVAGDTIPTVGPVDITSQSINILMSSGKFAGSARGTLAGVPGLMTTNANGQWRFARSRSGDAVKVPDGALFVPEPIAGTEAWLWMGRNGADAGHYVVDDIAAAVEKLGTEKVLVGAITGDKAGGVNVLLAKAYGARFVDIRGALLRGGNGSAEDAADVANGTIPRSLRSDGVHLNDAGYAIVAKAFAEAHRANGF